MDRSGPAIAAFERTLVQTDTPFDNYMRGDYDALSEAQKRGLDLFAGKANCIACHNGPLLSDEQYYNLGVPPYASCRGSAGGRRFHYADNRFGQHQCSHHYDRREGFRHDIRDPSATATGRYWRSHSHRQFAVRDMHKKRK